jgi:hypothetical protein
MELEEICNFKWPKLNDVCSEGRSLKNWLLDMFMALDGDHLCICLQMIYEIWQSQERCIPGRANAKSKRGCKAHFVPC